MEWQTSTASATGFTKEHIYAGQRRIAEVHTITGQAAKVTHSHPDPSGSPAMLSDASGLVSARESYRPYGDKLLSPNTNESAGFANKAFDANTNLSYMSARYYNPTLGRFISPDPVHFVEGNIHSFNRYAYANNNPMRFVDPDGKSAVHIGAFFAGFAIDAIAQTAVGVASGKSFGAAFSEVSIQSAAISGLATMATGVVGAKQATLAYDGVISAGKAAMNTAKASAKNTGIGNVVDAKLEGKSNEEAAAKGAIGVATGFAGGLYGGNAASRGAGRLNGMGKKGGINGHIEEATRSVTPGGVVSIGANAEVATKAVDAAISTVGKAAEKGVEK